MTEPSSRTEPSPICLRIDLQGISTGDVRLLVDDTDVSGGWFFRAPDPDTTLRAACLNASEGLSVGTYSLRAEVTGADGSVEVTTWTYDVVP